MRIAVQHLLFIVSTLVALPCLAQLELDSGMAGDDVLVLGHTGEPDSSGPVFQAVWHGVPGGNAQFQLHRMTSDAGDQRVMLDKVLESALASYLDSRIHFTKQGVSADLPANNLVLEMNAMIFSMLDHLGVQSDVEGFSASTRRQLERLINIDWSRSNFGVDGGGEQEKYLAIYYYVRSQREELERQMRADLLPLATTPLIRTFKEDLGRTVQIGSTCGTVFDEENYLCALDMQLADTGAGSVDPELGSWITASLEALPGPDTEQADPDQARVRKRDRWLKTELDRINSRIDKLDQRKELWELRDRMDDLEDRLTGIELELRDERKVQRHNENPAAELSDLTRNNITIRFTRNATQIDPEYRVLLNEVFEQMARTPRDRVLITGYSDRSGDPALNLKLSEQRAKMVRSYLMQRGISAERLLVNFYGDSRSTVNDPGQRRVEIEWLRD